MNLLAGYRMHVSSFFDILLLIQSYLEQILKQVIPWTYTLDELQLLVARDAAPKKRNKGKKAVKNTEALETKTLKMPEVPTAAAIAASIDIHTMWRVFGHYQQEKLLTILTHAELMGMAVRWFSKASIIFFFEFPPPPP